MVLSRTIERAAIAGAAICALALPSHASASGVTTHAFMAERAIPFVSEPRLRDLLASHVNEVLAGAHYPDAGYGSSSYPGGDFGEVTHWERFVNAYAAHLRGRADCAPLDDPSGPCASQVAHLMGVAAHGMGDEMWDWLFEPQMADYGESPVHPFYRAGLPGSAELGSVPPGSLINTPEFAMDNIALAEYGRAPKIPTYLPPVDDLLPTYRSIGRTDITEDGIYAGHALITAALTGERMGLAAEYPRVKLTMPRSAAAYLEGAGGVIDTAQAIGGYYDNVWAKLTTDGHPAPRIVNVNPKPGADTVKLDWLPVRASPGPVGGGAADRIIAVLANSLDVSSITPDTFYLLDGDGRRVAPAPGFPKPGPYGGGDGTHSMMFYPAENLVPCTRYTAVVSDGVRDHAGASLTAPGSWSFTTRAAGTDPCPEPKDDDPIEDPVEEEPVTDPPPEEPPVKDPPAQDPPAQGPPASGGGGTGADSSNDLAGASVEPGPQSVDTQVAAGSDGHLHPITTGSTVAIRHAALSTKGRVRIRVSCLGPDPCPGRMAATATSGRLVFSLGGSRFRIPTYGTQTLYLKLSTSARRTLIRRRKLVVQVRAHVIDAAGPGVKTVRRYTLRTRIPRRAAGGR